MYPKWYVQKEVAPHQWERLVDAPSVDQAARIADTLQKHAESESFRVEGPVWPAIITPYKPPMRGIPQPRDLSKVNT